MVTIKVAVEKDGTYTFKWPDGSQQFAQNVELLESKLRALHVDPYKVASLRSELAQGGQTSFVWVYSEQFSA